MFRWIEEIHPQGAQPLHELHMCTLPNSKSTCCRNIGNWCMEIGLPTAMNKTDWMWVESLQHWLKTKNTLKPRHDQIQVANLPEYDKLQHCPCMQNRALTGLQLLWISGNQLQTSLNQSGKYPAQQIQTEFISFCLDTTTYAHRITRSQTVSTNHLFWHQYYAHSCLLEKSCPSFQILKMTMDQEIGQPMIPFLILQQDRLWGHKVFLRNKMCCLLPLYETVKGINYPHWTFCLCSSIYVFTIQTWAPASAAGCLATFANTSTSQLSGPPCHNITNNLCLKQCGNRQ